MNIAIISMFNKPCLSNGLTQNVIFLKRVLENCGHKVTYVDISNLMAKGQDSIAKSKLYKEKDILKVSDLSSPRIKFDIILNPSFTPIGGDLEAIKKHQPQAKIVSIKYGNTVFSRMCTWAQNNFDDTYKFQDTKESPLKRETEKYDITLLSPHFYWAAQAEAALMGTEVKQIPYLWSPYIISDLAKEEEHNLNYVPNQKRKISVIEPNQEVAKNAYIPLATISHLLKTDPNSFDEANIGCGMKWAESPSIKAFITNKLDINKATNKVYFCRREPITQIFHEYNPLILSFQLFCELNYTYLEALHFGYPLVHNSKMIEGMGYYYKDFNCIDAANQTTRAFEEHDDALKEKLEKGRQFTSQFDPDGESVIKLYEELINYIVSK